VSVVNPTYKHLEQSLCVGRFSLGQWAQLLAAALVALGFGVYLSPLPPLPTVSVSVMVGGLPLALSYAAMGLEFSVLQFAASVAGWARRPHRYLAGPGRDTAGYTVHPKPIQSADETPARTPSTELAALWDA
jgi:hypothetical protein